jgi:hypothetical protein
MIKKVIILLFLLFSAKFYFAQSQYEVGKKMERVIMDLGTNYTKFQDAEGYYVLFYTIDVYNDALGFGNFSQSIYLHFDKNVCIGLDMSYPIIAVDHFELSYNNQFPRLNDNEWKSREGIYYILDRKDELLIVSIQTSEYYDKMHKK